MGLKLLATICSSLSTTTITMFGRSWTEEVGRDQWIIPGFHYVNRICFLLTEVAHFDAPIEFRIERGPHSLTPIGLARRITTLKRIRVRAKPRIERHGTSILAIFPGFTVGFPQKQKGG